MVELSVARREAPDAVVEPVEALLEHYRRYLTVERGLADASAGLYVRMVRPFLAKRASTGGLDLEHLTARDVSAFVVGACRDGRNASAKPMVTALRSLLVFLHIEGLICERLTGAVPSVAHWRLAGLPRALEADQTRRLLASCDRRTTIGRRDFAILTLLIRLGLRRGEVARRSPGPRSVPGVRHAWLGARCRQLAARYRGCFGQARSPRNHSCRG